MSGVELEDLDHLDPALVCATLGPMIADERRERIEAVLQARLDGVRMVIENLHDPHNGAAVLRSCEAFGLQRVHVVEAAGPFRFSSTVTQGCEKWLDIVRHPTLPQAMHVLRAAGCAIYAAVPGAAVAVSDLDLARPTAIMVGNEAAGLTGEAIAAADGRVGIAMPGMTRSLNLSVASALLASAAAGGRRAAIGRPGDLSPAELARLRARFYYLTVKAADSVLARLLSSR